MAVTPSKDISLGCSFTFAATAIDDVPIIDFTPAAVEAILVDMTDQANSTGFIEWEAANLRDAGKFSITVFHDQDYDLHDEVPTEGALVITWPSGTTFTCNAILESYTPGAATLNERMTADAVFQLNPTGVEPTIVDAV